MTSAAAVDLIASRRGGRGVTSTARDGGAVLALVIEGGDVRVTVSAAMTCAIEDMLGAIQASGTFSLPAGFRSTCAAVDGLTAGALNRCRSALLAGWERRTRSYWPHGRRVTIRRSTRWTGSSIAISTAQSRPRKCLPPATDALPGDVDAGED